MTDVEDPLAAEAPPVDRTPPRAPRKPRLPRSETRIADEPAFVLHSYPYKESSLIVDALTRHHGRIALVARGAKRPRSALRGVLLAFQPLTIGWLQTRSRAVSSASQATDLGTLTRAEWQGGMKPLFGDALMSGFYVNELVQKLVARDDPHERLFDAYLEALDALSDDRPAAPVLRRFEVELLREAGYAVQTEQSIDGQPIEPDARYRYVPERGPMRVDRVAGVDAAADATVDGRTLIDIERGTCSDPVVLGQAKRLLRHLLQHHLAGQVLQTRRVLLDLQALDEGSTR